MKKEKNYIISEYDKFNKQTTTRTLPLNKYRSQSCIVWHYQTSEDKRNYSLASNIRHIKSPDSESLILDFDLIGESWIFFRNGSIQLICDDENLTIQANESYSNTESGGGINENFYYKIDQDILKKICDSKELSIRLNGDQQVELKKERLEVFQIMCQQFYNNFYDHKLYIEALSKSTKTKFTFNFKNIVVIIAILLSLCYFYFKYFEPNLKPEKVKIEQIDNNEIYSIGTNIAEGVAASLAVGFSSIDSGLTYEVKTSNDVFTSQGNTWPIIDVSVIVNSEILSNPNITFVLFLEIDNSSGTKAGTVKNIKVDGLPDPSLELMNNTMYIKTVEGIEQVKLIDGELRIVEYNIPDNTNNTITNVIETPSEIDSSNGTQKLMSNYYISILKNKKFINIRKTPVIGEIIEKVSGGDVFTVINEFETPDPVYLLNKKILLTDINTGETIEKPLGFKLNSIKNISDSIYYAEITNIDKSINKVVIYESNFTKSKSRWLYLKEVNGWIYSDFCRIISEQTFKSRNEGIPPLQVPPAPEKNEIVEDEKEVEETVIESTETDETEEIIVEEIQEVKETEEVIEDVSFMIIDDVPVFPGCKGDKAALKKCFSKMVQKHFSTKFDADLPNELGLDAGRKKVFIGFKIDRNGNVVNIQARAPHPKIKKEIVKVMKMLPKMKPGRQRGKAVGVKYSIPFTLIVE
jgi:periplasmic protein TonB